MADTTSIASRMEKLAKLKRMREGLTSTAPEAPAKAVPNTEATPSPTEGFETFPSDQLNLTEEPQFPAEAELSDPEDLTIPDDLLDIPELQDDSSNTDPTGVEDGETSPEAFTPEAAVPLDDAMQEGAADPDGSDVNFVMDSPNEPSADEIDDDFIPADLEIAEADATAEFHESSLGLDDEAMADFDETAALAGAGGVAAAVAASSTGTIEDDAIESAADTQVPDFSTKDIDVELLDREFENEAALEKSIEATSPSNAGSPGADEDTADRTTVSFDESRSKLLEHVSRQMGCSVEDVVVTAVDWYLDALFGEDEEAKSA